MTYFIIILIILIVFLFTNLNDKIRKLEKEVAELSKKVSNKPTDKENKTLQNIDSTPEATGTPEIKILTEQAVPEYETPEKQEKDWLAPVFDFLKQNALTIIGIFTLVLGIGYFVKYAIDKNWIGETSRAAIGFLAGGIIMAAGHFLRKNYTAFASIISGGGIAVLYFTTTIAFREYHLFSQNTAFSVACFITVVCISLSYYYDSEVLTIFSLFGGFFAPLMISTGESNYLFLFTYLTVLNIGMLIIVFLKNRKSIGWISFIFTIGYLFYWTISKTEILSVYFYIIAYILFYLFALQQYFRKSKLLSSDMLMLVFINFTSIIGLVYIFNTLQYEPVTIFPLIFALVNLGLLYREYSRKNLGVNYSVFAGITISLFTIAIALQFKPHLITSVWAIEATLLLFIWKKTNLNIFKICFYILFPLVIMAQMITWAEYFDAKDLPVILNPIFLTSSVTVITVFINLILLKKLSDQKSENISFFENVFAVVSYGVIYVALLLEIIYQISGKPWIFIFSTAMLYSMYFIFFILLFRKKLEINKILETAMLYLFFSLVMVNTLVSGPGIISQYLLHTIRLSFYGFYLLYWIPFIFILLNTGSKSGFFTLKLSYWYMSLACVAAVSGELYNIYLLTNADNISDIAPVTKHFSLLYLPIIWAVLASLFLYKGLKSDHSEYNKIGFALIAVMVLKLYIYDVWKMDNVSRIIAFIILGIILLFSSFLFQRVKRMIRNMVESKEENPGPEKTEM